MKNFRPVQKLYDREIQLVMNTDFIKTLFQYQTAKLTIAIAFVVN
uniref:Neur_chan_LBD domain-containing protein n=1 Tax=Elaeophora elaphi TaxID=1147741 RepID=A0A0R3RLE0_9BILA